MWSDSIRGMKPACGCLPGAVPNGFRMLTDCAFSHTVDAMNEVAWCYLEGFGTKKDKVSHILSLDLPSGLCTSGPLSCLSTTPASFFRIPLPGIVHFPAHH